MQAFFVINRKLFRSERHKRIKDYQQSGEDEKDDCYRICQVGSQMTEANITVVFQESEFTSVYNDLKDAEHDSGYDDSYNEDIQ